MRAQAELLRLARSLRLRAARSHDADWHAPEKTAAGKADPTERLEAMRSEIAACQACPLGRTRIKAVPGVGSVRARVMFIGEGPGYEEDRKGEPFVGEAGHLLDRILAAMGLSRSTVFIANIVKCHPMKDPGKPDARGNDRPPAPEEIAACRHFVDEQTRLIRPEVIVALGAVAARALLETSAPIGRIRGQWAEYRAPADAGEPIRLMPTFHPAAVLRDPALKQAVWKDMKAVLAAIGQEMPK